MQRLNVIPYPNRVTFLNGTVQSTMALANVQTKTLPGKMGEEAYQLTVTQEGATIVCSTPKGEFYARKTLEQMASASEMPCVKIEDAPAYAVRGFMIDTVRHICALEDTKRLIDAMASVKMNTLHWHLSDDQGWRVQIDSHPKLTEKGSVRQASLFGNENDYTPYGGWFSKAQIKEIVAYAAERFIDVVPEIDMPGHMSALLHAYPEVSCRGGEIEVVTKQGIFPEILCAGKEETFRIIFDILDELCELFPSPYFHIGGDEVPKKYWKMCPDCQKRMQEHGLKNEEELQGWFVQRVKRRLAAKGKKCIVWNESLKSGTVTDVRVQHWAHDPALSVDYANRGGQVVMSSFFHYYLDYPYSMTPLKKTYDFNPRVRGLTDVGHNNIVGVECPVWTEYIRDFSRFCYQAFPRATAVAETGWTVPAAKDEKDFERRFSLYEPMLRSFGIVPAEKKEWNPDVLRRLPVLFDFLLPTVKSQFAEFLPGKKKNG